jgi:hypothetical protein
MAARPPRRCKNQGCTASSGRARSRSARIGSTSFRRRPPIACVGDNTRRRSGFSVIARGLSKNPAARYPTIEALGTALDAVAVKDAWPGRRILVADDDAPVRDLYSLVASRIGVEADIVCSGRDAIEALNRGRAARAGHRVPARLRARPRRDSAEDSASGDPAGVRRPFASVQRPFSVVPLNQRSKRFCS